MESLDPAKNDESSGFSKRRISSILKAPRKSIRLPDPEQQENVVECAKPVEKRNSRRVSFAPANDVLLFSKDVKNASPARSPFQELITTTTASTQNRVQVAVTEDGSQQIGGMETLLSAPLHTSKQRDKVNFDTGDDFGEKTMMFSTDDAFMDMTHSHTINIANDGELLADISLQNYDILPTSREKKVMFTADDGSMDMTLSHTLNMTSGSVSLPASRSMDLGAEKRSISSSVPCLDPGFENFLSGLFKPSGPSVNPAITRMTLPAGASSEEPNRSLAQIKTHRAGVDKENQAPTSVSAVMEKSLNTSRKVGEPSYGSALYPQEDVSMDMTDVQRFTDDDDPFQCLFPTPEMYSHLDRVSQTAEKTKQQQSSKTLTSFNPKDMISLKNPSLHTSHQRLKVNLDPKDECREKTVVFTAGDEFMDMTQSHTVNISNDSLPPPNQNHTHGKMDRASSANGSDPEFKSFLASLFKSAPSDNPVMAGKVPPTAASSKETVDRNSSVSRLKADVEKEKQSLNTTKSFGESFDGGTMCPENDVSMDLTEVHTGHIVGLTGSDDPFQFLCPTQDMSPPKSLKKAETISGQKSSAALGSSKSAGLETSLKPSLKTKAQRYQVQFDAEDDYREKTVRFSADDACMDVTQSHTVNIATDFATQDTYLQSGHMKKAEMISRQQPSEALGLSNRKGMETLLTASLKTKVQRHQVKFDAEDDCREKTVRFSADDACMDVTQSHTVNIVSDFDPRSHRNVDYLPACGDKTVRFTANDAAMDVTQSHTVNIVSDLKLHSQQNVDFLPACGEKTVRFSANDACMDVTQSHTVNIVSDFDPRSHQNVDYLPACGEKTVRFSANDAAMDVTQSHTVNIVSDFNPQSHQNVELLPACSEKTVRFSANDAAMDVTKSHTVNIVSDLGLHSNQNGNFIPACGEKTVRFTANDAAMDVTGIHSVTHAPDLDPQSHPNVDFLPACGDKTVRFTANDAAMDVTQSHTVNIASNLVSDSVLPRRDSTILSTHENMDFPLSVKKRENETCRSRRNRSSLAHTLDPGFKTSLSKRSGLWANPVITKAAAHAAPSLQETADTNDFLNHLKTQKPDVSMEKEAPGFVSAVMESPVKKTMTDCREGDVSMDMTEGQTGHILEQACADESPQCLSSTPDLYPNSDHLNKTEVSSQQSNGALGSFNPDGVEITNRPDSPDSNETDNRKKPEPRNQTCSPGAVDHDADTVTTHKSRRMSLADLHSKVRRLSHMINTAPDTNALDGCTVPLPQMEHDMDRNSKDQTKSLPVVEPELEMSLVNAEENTQAQCLMEPSTTTTPFNLKTKQLMSRLSVGGFKPKLPQRSKPDDPKKVNSVGEHTRTITVNVTNQLSNFDDDVSDIYDEELDSCEDMSEMLDKESPQKATEKVSPSQEFYMAGSLDDDGFDLDFLSAVNGKKRPLPVDEKNMEDEKRMKASTEMASDFEMGLQSHLVECDSNMTRAPSMTTQTTDDSSSHTASIRCEATFESTFKQSLFESQLEDCSNDVQRKFDDGTITVLEFFKLFNIDFVIHNPRQSVLPGRLLSDTDRTPMDLLKDRHINRPKQMVYETNVLNLTEKVEGLKERMQDLDKPLKIVNRPLWEEMRNSSEKELKSFGAKLKERNNLFRKMSKAQSHEMKEVLYSNLVQANLEEQQRLRGTIEEADEMIKSLDDCIRGLETELAAVEEKGFEDTPSLKSRMEEVQKITEALTDNDRQISELELEKMHNSKKLNRLKAETRNLENHVTALHMVNEWKFGETRDNCTIYTFLHDTFHLQLVYEKSSGNDADNQSERKISNITFKYQLDDEKSQDHACLAHKLLSRYIEGEAAWVEKYPTSRHVPKLLHDVGLVVSRCRLLGEELRLLKMWGGLRLDILSISCVDTQVHIVFSSLKKFSKFEVMFSVSLTNLLCVFQLESFKNVIGSTTMEQIEEIVALFSPAKNLLTKIVKKIHEKLLC